MSLTFNMVGGGGSGKVLPAITVTFPEGSICTCSNGIKTLKAKTTSGLWIFTELSIGVWTVTSTDPTGANKPASKDVEINSEGQNVSVELSYITWLFDEGNQFESVTGGWTGSGYTVSSARDKVNATVGTTLKCTVTGQYQEAIAGTNNAIDLTKIDTLCVRVSAFAGTQGCVFVAPSKNYNEMVAQTVISATGDYTLDASQLIGNYYVGVLAVSAKTYSDISYSKVWGA